MISQSIDLLVRSPVAGVMSSRHHVTVMGFPPIGDSVYHHFGTAFWHGYGLIAGQANGKHLHIYLPRVGTSESVNVS